MKLVLLATNLTKISKMIKRLQPLAEEQYRIFNQKFVLTNKNPMMGVKVPKMRDVAKEVVKGDWREFLGRYGFYLNNAPEEVVCRCKDIWYEEIMIIGMVIDLANMTPDERLKLVALFVPLIDNWAVCDVFCGGAKWVGEPGKGAVACNRVPRGMVWEFLQPYLHSNKEFEIRFGVVMLMSYFLTEEYLDRVFDALANVQFGAYYVDMGVAWTLATARAKFDKQTCSFIERENLPAGVVKKYEQKVRDSRRVPKNG